MIQFDPQEYIQKGYLVRIEGHSKIHVNVITIDLFQKRSQKIYTSSPKQQDNVDIMKPMKDESLKI